MATEHEVSEAIDQSKLTDSITRSERTADAWWSWHDADASRWSPGEDSDAATADAEARCAAWLAGESDDGPS